jgi:hypothetical protein
MTRERVFFTAWHGAFFPAPQEHVMRSGSEAPAAGNCLDGFMLKSYNGETEVVDVIKRAGEMEIITYIGFVVAALILIWAVYELARRYDRKRFNARDASTWVRFDATSLHEDEALPVEVGDEDGEEPVEQSLNNRAKQNGHYSESKKLS